MAKHSRLKQKIVHSGGQEFYVNPLKQHFDILWTRQRGMCMWCGSMMIKRTMHNSDGSMDKSKATIDHVVSLAEGGSNEFSNLALACYGCNALRAKYSTLHSLGQALEDAQKQVDILQNKYNNLHIISLSQKKESQSLRDQRDQALKALDLARNVPPPACRCILCAGLRTAMLLIRTVQQLFNALL